MAAAGGRGRGRRLVLKEEAPKGLEEQHYSIHALCTEWSYHSPTAAQGHVCVCVCVCVFVCVCMYMCVCVYIYI